MAAPAVTNIGADNIATGQVTATTTVGALVPARTGRQKITIIGGATAVAVGGPAVTATTGLLVGTGAVAIDTAAALSVITASGTQVVSYLETF